MKRFLLAIAVLFLAAHAQAADLTHKVLYGLEVANCAFKASDVGTTAYGVFHVPGTYETNKFLRGNGRGHLNWPLFIALNATQCAAPPLLSWYASRHERNADLFLIGPSVVLGGWSAWATVHNWKYIRAWQAEQ